MQHRPVPGIASAAIQAHRYRMPGTLKEVTAPMKIFPTFEDKYTNFDLTYEGGSSYYSFSAHTHTRTHAHTYTGRCDG